MGSPFDEPMYQLLRQIAENSTTEIHQAVEVHTSELFAIKFPLPECEQTAVEAAVLRDLDHAAIIRLADVVPTDSGPALVLPYARGGDLFTLVTDRGFLPEPLVKAIAARILSALAYLHERRIVHRDVKLENMSLMTDDVDGVVLGDFGYAVELPEGECGESACGSPNYAAPEIWQQRPYCEKVDIWSLGVAMFVMLAGEFPYALERGCAAVEGIARGIEGLDANPEFQRISVEGRHLLWRMLQMGPDERISAVDALNHGWFMRSESDPEIGEKEGVREVSEVVMADEQGLCWR